jgi:competence protein J (ComJ)
MKKKFFVLTPKLCFSCGQFFVYDKSVGMPACDWTDTHSDQGFARRKGTAAFGTLLEFGEADVTVHREPYQQQEGYERVIAVPLLVSSGTVNVDGPEENEYDVERGFDLPPGNYRLVAAQRVTGDDEETIDLFFELLPRALERSSILVADEDLNPPKILIETADVPEGPK